MTEATEVPEAIRTWAGRPGAAALLAAARGKVETGRSGDGSRLPVDDAHRADVGRLLGVPWELSGRPVTLRLLRRALESVGTTLEAVLVTIGGPLRNAAAEKAEAAAAAAALQARLLEVLTEAGIPGPVARMGLRWLGTADQAEETAAQVARAWTALPSRPGEPPAGGHDGWIGLPVFAGQVLDDPHALDRDQPAGRALARSIAATHAATTTPDAPPGEEWSDAQTQAAAAAASNALAARAWRAAWARVELQCDQVSSTVLVLNLPLTSPNPTLAPVTSVAGEPLWVTSRMTDAGCAVTAADTDTALVVRVCENPAVMEAAAAELGAGCPPLVCVYGRPSSAAWDVLDAVVAAGGRLLVTGDRDDAGRQITREVTDAYPDAVVSAWLPAAAGVYEEQRLPQLLADLAR